jgi:NAD(P)H-nitrite reductase large subunit
VSQEHFVIIGNGAAANRAADVLRLGDPDARITLISDEFFHFYHRHRLAEYLTGEVGEAELLVRTPQHYQDRRIRLRLGQRVTRVDPQNKILYLKHMETVRYTRLLLCTGGKPRLPEVCYAFRPHFTTVKTLADARQLRSRLDGVREVIVVGGDLVSVRLADALIVLGKRVTFLVDADAFWPLELGPADRAEFAAGLARRGIAVQADDALAVVEPHPAGGYLVGTRAGHRLHADLVGAFFGLVPDVDFLLGTGLNIDRGLLVNEYLQTNLPDIYAAGDCAQVYNPALRNYWVSIGWPNAEKLGEVAARNLLGQVQAAGPAPAKALEFEGVVVNTAWWRQM